MLCCAFGTLDSFNWDRLACSLLLSVCLSVCLPIYLSVCLSLSLSLCLSVCLHVSLSAYDRRIAVGSQPQPQAQPDSARLGSPRPAANAQSPIAPWLQIHFTRTSMCSYKIQIQIRHTDTYAKYANAHDVRALSDCCQVVVVVLLVLWSGSHRHS